MGWEADGGIGRISIDDAGFLTVTTVGEVQDEIARLLQALRAAAARAQSKPGGTPAAVVTAPENVPPTKTKSDPRQPAARPAPHLTESQPPLTDVEAKLLASLAQKLDVRFEAMPLHEVVDYLGNRTKTPLFLDRRSLENADISRAAPVTLQLKDGRLDKILESVLEQVDLTFIIRDEVIVITTRDECERAQTQRVYPVFDFAPSDNPDVVRDLLENVADAIQMHTGQPNGWMQAGGTYRLTTVTIAKALAVRATPEVHQEVERYLSSLRAARGTQPVIAPKEPPVVTRRYSPPPLTMLDRTPMEPEEFVAIMKFQLSDFEFDPQRHALQMTGRIILLKHSTAVHRYFSRHGFAPEW